MKLGNFKLNKKELNMQFEKLNEELKKRLKG